MELKPGQSASQAIRKWLSGLTIAECGSALVAIHLDVLRQRLGDEKFDECFGSSSGARPLFHPLRVSADHGECFPLQLLKAAGTNEDGKPVLKLGAKYHFRNHDAYAYRHPAGDFVGQNAIFLGEHPRNGAMWSGFGVRDLSTSGLKKMLHDAYLAERKEEDYEAILFNESTRADPDWIRTQSDHGHSFKSIYEVCKNRNLIHPAFIEAEEVSEASDPRDIDIEGQGIMLDLAAIDRLRADESASGAASSGSEGH